MKKVLYVERDMTDAKHLVKLLEKKGFIINTTSSGTECLLKEEHDFYVLSTNIPDISAWELFKELRKKSSKIIFASDIPISVERREELLTSGVYDYLNKPIKKELLINCITKKSLP